MSRRDAIHQLACECARDALAGTPPGGYTHEEGWDFRRAFDAAVADTPESSA